MLSNYKLEDDSKVWIQGAHTFSPEGRAKQVEVANPNVSYLGDHPPGTIAERASPDGPLGCKPVFQSAVPRIHKPEATDQGAKFARGSAPDPSFPGPGHYQVTTDWQRHDMLIKLDTHHFKVRPHAVFELPKVRPLRNKKMEHPGPGWYEAHRKQQTGDSPSAPAWQPVVPLAEQAQDCDKSPPPHSKLMNSGLTWNSGGRAAATAMSTAARSRFETTVSQIGARKAIVQTSSCRARAQRSFHAITCHVPLLAGRRDAAY